MNKNFTRSLMGSTALVTSILIATQPLEARIDTNDEGSNIRQAINNSIATDKEERNISQAIAHSIATDKKENDLRQTKDNELRQAIASSIATAKEESDMRQTKDNELRQAIASSIATAKEESDLRQAIASSISTAKEESDMRQAIASSILTAKEESDMRQAIANSILTAKEESDMRQAIANSILTAKEESELRQAIANSIATANKEAKKLPIFAENQMSEDSDHNHSNFDKDIDNDFDGETYSQGISKIINKTNLNNDDIYDLSKELLILKYRYETYAKNAKSHKKAADVLELIGPVIGKLQPHLGKVVNDPRLFAKWFHEYEKSAFDVKKALYALKTDEEKAFAEKRIPNWIKNNANSEELESMDDIMNRLNSNNRNIDAELNQLKNELEQDKAQSLPAEPEELDSMDDIINNFHRDIDAELEQLENEVEQGNAPSLPAEPEELDSMDDILNRLNSNNRDFDAELEQLENEVEQDNAPAFLDDIRNNSLKLNHVEPEQRKVSPAISILQNIKQGIELNKTDNLAALDEKAEKANVGKLGKVTDKKMEDIDPSLHYNNPSVKAKNDHILNVKKLTVSALAKANASKEKLKIMINKSLAKSQETGQELKNKFNELKNATSRLNKIKKIDDERVKIENKIREIM